MATSRAVGRRAFCQCGCTAPTGLAGCTGERVPPNRRVGTEGGIGGLRQRKMSDVDLVGRSEEKARLDDLLAASARGQGGSLAR